MLATVYFSFPVMSRPGKPMVPEALSAGDREAATYCAEGWAVVVCCAAAGLTVRHIQAALKRKKGHFFMGAKVKYPFRS